MHRIKFTLIKDVKKERPKAREYHTENKKGNNNLSCPWKLTYDHRSVWIKPTLFCGNRCCLFALLLLRDRSVFTQKCHWYNMFPKYTRVAATCQNVIGKYARTHQSIISLNSQFLLRLRSKCLHCSFYYVYIIMFFALGIMILCRYLDCPEKYLFVVVSWRARMKN